MKACLYPGVKKELIDERVGRKVIAFGQRQATEEEEGGEEGGWSEKLEFRSVSCICTAVLHQNEGNPEGGLEKWRGRFLPLGKDRRRRRRRISREEMIVTENIFI